MCGIKLDKEQSQLYREINSILFDVFHGSLSKIEKWWHTGNPNFGGSSPKYLLVMGRGHKILALIKEVMEESKGADP